MTGLTAFLAIVCVVLGVVFLRKRVETGLRHDPGWRPSLALRSLATLLALVVQLVRAWYVLAGAFFGGIFLLGAIRLAREGHPVEAWCMGGVALFALVASFRWFALHSDWRDPEPTPTDAELDANTLRSLQERGVDLTKPVSLSFYMYFGSEESARQAAATGATPLLRASVSESHEALWVCQLSGSIVASSATIREHSTRLLAVAQSLGGEYTGWGLAAESSVTHDGTSEPLTI